MSETTPPPVTLRRADPAEAPALAALHLAVWRETYRDLAPAAAYQQLDLDWRLRQWQRWLDRPAPHATWVAETATGLVGLVSVAPNATPVYAGRGEVEHLYVLPEARGLGLGRRLLTHALGHLRQAGFPGAGLAVVRGNTAARAFYATAGGHEAAAFTDPGPLWRSDNLLVVWDWPVTAA